MINIPKYDRIDLRQIAYLEKHIKIWKNGTCTLNIEKRQGKSRFEEKKFQKVSTIWWCMYGYEIEKENISSPRH